jgi:uncharacterized protein involved in high-affinity Fe2+ transport
MEIGYYVKFKTGSHNDFIHYGKLIKENKKSYKIRFIWTNDNCIERNINKENVVGKIKKSDYDDWEYYFTYKLTYNISFKEASRSMVELDTI